MNIASTLVWF